MGAYLSLSGKGRAVGCGWTLIRGRALINFSCLWDGRLFEVGANSSLGAYSNKYNFVPAGTKIRKIWIFWTRTVRILGCDSQD